MPLQKFKNYKTKIKKFISVLVETLEIGRYDGYTSGTAGI